MNEIKLSLKSKHRILLMYHYVFWYSWCLTRLRRFGKTLIILSAAGLLPERNWGGWIWGGCFPGTRL